MSDPQLIDRLKALWTITVRRGDYAVEFVDIVERDDRLFATVRTLTWSGDQLNDIREQEALFGVAEDFDKDDRNTAMVEAWAAVVEEVFANMTLEIFNGLMPEDLVFSDLGSLGNCETRLQFDKALRAKKRLGAYLPAQTTSR